MDMHMRARVHVIVFKSRSPRLALTTTSMHLVAKALTGLAADYHPVAAVLVSGGRTRRLGRSGCKVGRDGLGTWCVL